jgi:hypothetical protein
MFVKPKLSRDQLKEAVGMTARDGREYHMELPGVWTDAKWAARSDKVGEYDPKWHDPRGYESNRKMGQRIGDVFRELKPKDDDGNHFIYGWRIYPNKEHPRWQREQPHACGCGCGCACGCAGGDGRGGGGGGGG